MNARNIIVMALLCVLAPLPLAAMADTPAELLEKGIYHEETVGNLDEAIRIYREVVAEGERTQAIAAEAQYRLGQCLSKQGKSVEAQAAFQDVVKRFPEQKELVAKARKLLPAEVELQATPWKDGERLTLTMKLASGQPIGIVATAVDAGQERGRDIWRMRVRRFISGGANQGVSQIVVDRATNRPLSTQWDHTLLGTSRSVWEDDKILITTPGKGDEPETTTTVTLDGMAFENDQMFFAFRQLPLAVGYKVTVPLRIGFSGGNALGLELEVTKKERIDAPVGSYDCFRLESNIGQTFWIADVPERYVVRFEANGVVADLTAIGDGSATKVRNDALGFSVTVPERWFHYDATALSEKDAASLALVSPEMGFAAVEVESSSRLKQAERESPSAWADSKIERAKTFFKGLTVVPDSRSETRQDGAPAVTFQTEQELAGRPYKVAAIVAIKGEKAVELSVWSPKDTFPALSEAFVSIRESLTVD
jgi:hypothetical protein